ncbi:MAG: hypothetical protein CW338_02820, partial [Clostridiales bacterium]|nr:hypothetical protein [Clostridiales bacterium]
YQNWGADFSEPVTVKSAEITGAGEYFVGLEFATPAEGLAFAALGIVNGEKTFPGACIKITSVRINGESIDLLPGYTSSDDGICTRMNIYNEWVSSRPDDARVCEGELDDTSWIMVDKALFASVSSIDVDFIFDTVSDRAYIMFADSAWAMQNWGIDSSDTCLVDYATIDGEGTYTTSIEFASPAAGCAFTALGIETGELTFGGYTIEIKSILIDGVEVPFTKGYTSSDDGICTRMNIFNEWVSALPEDARSFDGDLEGASWIIVDTAAFASFSKMEVTFTYHYGVPATKNEAAPITADEAKELFAAEMHAYIAVQGKDTYVFRNGWADNYGLNDTEHPYFYQLTGWADTATWCAENGFEVPVTDDASVNMGGEFTDAIINGAGEYTVSLTTGDMGFGATESFNMLYVSTDIPAALVRDGFVTITDVKCKIGDSKTLTMEHEYLDCSGDYVLIKMLDSYNFSSEPFGYTVPGANSSITITFTLNSNIE